MQGPVEHYSSKVRRILRLDGVAVTILPSALEVMSLIPTAGICFCDEHEGFPVPGCFSI